MKNSLEATWSASKTQMSSDPGTRVPGGYSWAHTLLMLPDFPFISPASLCDSLRLRSPLLKLDDEVRDKQQDRVLSKTQGYVCKNISWKEAVNARAARS